MDSDSKLNPPVAHPSPPAKAAGSDSPDSDKIIDEVREILFGRQLREIEARFGRLEEMILTHNSRLLNLFDKRMAVFEQRIDAQSQSIRRLRREKDDAVEQLESSLKNELSSLRGDFDAIQAGLQQQLSQLHETLEAETARLRHGAEAHDRDLAELFQEMARRLTGASAEHGGD